MFMYDVYGNTKMFLKHSTSNACKYWYHMFLKSIGEKNGDKDKTIQC
jgi:hypothetical protein